jgi:hypothetical protein
VTTHLLLVAGLKNPTVRQRYVALRELLAEYGCLAAYEMFLDMLGCAQLSRARVEHHLAALSEAFDSAASVITTPFPFAADISTVAIAIDGSRRMIERGDHRDGRSPPLWSALITPWSGTGNPTRTDPGAF